MNSVLFLEIILAFAVSASRKYDLEEQSNKLFGKTFTQVLEDFRGTSEYMDILKQRVSDWKKSAEFILMALDEDQTAKFLEAVETRDSKTTESIENTRRNLNGNNKTSVELLDSYSYAKLTSEEKVKLINIAFKHVGAFLHAYMEALSPDALPPSSNGTANDHTHDVPEVNSHEVIQLKVNKVDMTKGVEVTKVTKEGPKPQPSETEDTPEKGVNKDLSKKEANEKEVTKEENVTKQEEVTKRQEVTKREENSSQIMTLKNITPNSAPFDSVKRTVVNNVTFISEETQPSQ